jgi:hypothetical protein
MRSVEHQCAVAFYMWWSLYGWRRFKVDQRLLYAIPNGGERHAAVAARLKQEGVRAGVPDYFLAVPRAGKHGLYLELKAGGPGVEKGRPTKEQLEFGALVQEQGYEFQVVYGAEEAESVVQNYLLQIGQKS